MTRRDWILALIRSSVGAALLYPVASIAEYGIGQGSIEEPTRRASEHFNEGIAALHLMFAALDRKDADKAVVHQARAAQQIQEAANLFQDAVGKADQHVLKPTPKTEQEKTSVKYFSEHAGDYSISVPVSQRDLLVAIASQVASLAGKIKGTNPKELLGNLRRTQALATTAVELQQFLLSVTTVLTLG
jgi:hypothetical protein